MTYATVSFLEPETQAEQQRTTAIVKTSDKGGYYIDVFRSRKKEGATRPTITSIIIWDRR